MLSIELRLCAKRAWKSVLSRGISQLHTAAKNGQTDLSSVENEDDVFKREDYFKVSDIFTVKDMFEAKVHLGHKEVSINDRMRRYVFGSRLGHVIFDLDITAYHLRKALNFSAHIAYRGGIILFVSQNKQNTVTVENTAKECKEFAYSRIWITGLFSRSFDIYKTETRLPDLCIFLNTKYETGQVHNGIVDATRALIPTIAVVDSDCEPNLITYPVPGNDDSPSSIKFFCNAFKTAILRGKAERKKREIELSKKEKKLKEEGGINRKLKEEGNNLSEC